MNIDYKKLDQILKIDLDEKIKEYFDSKLSACDLQGIEENNNKAKELLQIAKDFDELNLSGDFLRLWNQHFNIEEEDWNDLQIEKIFYYR